MNTPIQDMNTPIQDMNTPIQKQVINVKITTITMASRKGVIATGVILAIITAASFMIWIIPVNNESTLVVSDYKAHLNGVKNIHEVLQESINIEYEKLLNGVITPNEYIETTEATSSQITAQISEFITSNPPEPWEDSYIEYMEALRKFNQYVAETRVLADMIENNESQDEIAKVTQRIESLRTESQEYVESSNNARP